MSKRKKPKAERQPNSQELVKPSEEVATTSNTHHFVIRHLRIGWWSLLLFLTLGIALEAMHGFKVQWYLGEQNATRRLMFTLAHVHGTLLSLVHLGFAASVHIMKQQRPSTSHLERNRIETMRSWLLSLATALIPCGFFVGGWNIYDGDPSLGILLVPIGAACLFSAVLLQAITVGLR